MFKQMTILGAAIVFSFFLLSSSAYAYATLDDYTLNFSGAAEHFEDEIDNVENVAEWQTRGRTFIGFDDNDGSNGVSEGDTFDNYFAIRVSEIQNSDGGTVSSSSYGNSDDATHEMTILGYATGYQDTENTFVIDSLPLLDIYFDAGEDFSQANFADLDTFGDGLNVETATDGLIKGGGTNEGGGDVSGTFDLFADLEDEMFTTTGEYFELDKDGDPLPMELIFGVADSNTDAGDIDVGAFETYFGFDADEDWNFYATADADGSIKKQVVPEPAAMLLFGTGLLGLGFFGRRKFMNMNKKA